MNMAYVGMKLEEQMLVDHGFSVSAGNIIESSNSASLMVRQHSPSSGSETSLTIINKTVKRKKNQGASNKTIRKKMNSHTQTVKTTNLTDDGYGWRKYGQKIIHNDRHPKSYYRCTHSTEEKCEAKKWVQQESENPPVYKTTYIGHHTCKNPHKIPQIFYPDYSSFSSPSSSDTTIQSFDHGYYVSEGPNINVLRFDSPNTINHVPNVNMDHMNGQMEPIATPPPIPTVDSMMFPEGLENVTYGHEDDYYFPSIPSPNCYYGSYDMDMMMLEEYLAIGLDRIDFMQEC